MNCESEVRLTGDVGEILAGIRMIIQKELKSELTVTKQYESWMKQFKKAHRSMKSRKSFLSRVWYKTKGFWN